MYRGTGVPHDGIDRLPEAPPWRSFPHRAARDDLLNFSALPVDPVDDGKGRRPPASLYQVDRAEIHLVNMALLLRRPLLVTGSPGVGKSTLAHSIAHELNLGPVLRWSVTSRTSLQDGLYQYDAIGRLQDAGLTGHRPSAPHGRGGARGKRLAQPLAIGRYLRLGPLGTAFLPWRNPRVLLIDEIDKSDVDFPSDLLHVFEEGEFSVPELARLHAPSAKVMTADDQGRVEVRQGRVRCHQFPVVVMTSNEERQFSPAFLRRCIRLNIPQPDEAKLVRLLAAHLPTSGSELSPVHEELIREFLRRQSEDGAQLANDQLLNAVLVARQLWESSEGRETIVNHLLRPLNEA
ncbi:AAA family ATPase [Streptomyces phaeochromogenes]|uniref:AAA family ATPase n=1 Tax=Streptomyces phaeochromogenes TaxID=1923 RepID=UPI0038687245|nr:MoxR family ATPase [Streptomyces phaeochromogenes]